MLRTSTHALADQLKQRPATPVRAVTIGRFIVMWDGQKGDFIETVDTDDFLGGGNATGQTKEQK